MYTLHLQALRAFELKERELHSVVAKLLVSETATEPSFTCTQCMSLFKDPVTCVPCGHSFCKCKSRVVCVCVCVCVIFMRWKCYPMFDNVSTPTHTHTHVQPAWRKRVIAHNAARAYRSLTTPTDCSASCLTSTRTESRC
jgi:hypothetical protein